MAQSEPDSPVELSPVEGSKDLAEDDEIETDRDSFTPATSTVGSGRVVFESAYSYINNRKVDDTNSLPEMVVRYGLNNIVEVRFGYNYEEGGAGNPVSGNVPDDLEEESIREYSSKLLYGAKVSLSDQSGWMPQSSVIVQGSTPTNGENRDTNLSAFYVFGYKMSNACIWDSGLRYATGSFEEDDFNTWSPSTVFKVPLGERWKAHVEYFGVFSSGREKESTQHFFSPGAHILLSQDIEVGARVGWGLNDQAPHFFSNIGLGYRF